MLIDEIANVSECIQRDSSAINYVWCSVKILLNKIEDLIRTTKFAALPYLMVQLNLPVQIIGLGKCKLSCYMCEKKNVM